MEQSSREGKSARMFLIDIEFAIFLFYNVVYPKEIGFP